MQIVKDLLQVRCTSSTRKYPLRLANKPRLIFTTDADFCLLKQSLDATMEEILRTRADAKDSLNAIVLIILLPENAAPIRTAVKYWGDQRNGE